MSFKLPIEWARQFAATMDDATSLRHMRNFAQDRLNGNASIRASIVEAHGEQEAIDEWDKDFAADDADDREAIRLIEARLAELGLEP